MKKLITKSNGNGLPISSVANLCYLPEKINRSKKEKTFYQDDTYKKHINLKDIEDKYSFTTQTDLEWTDMDYGAGDFEVLKDFYFTFLAIRFKRKKEMFYKSMNIHITKDDLDEAERIHEEPTISQKSSKKTKNENTIEKPASFHDDCIAYLNNSLKMNLVKRKRSLYSSEDNTLGIIVSVSKQYAQGDKEKYWFAYRSSTAEILSEYKKNMLHLVVDRALIFFLYLLWR